VDETSIPAISFSVLTAKIMSDLLPQKLAQVSTFPPFFTTLFFTRSQDPWPSKLLMSKQIDNGNNSAVGLGHRSFS